MKWPTITEIGEANPSQIETWYQCLPDPSNEFEEKLLEKICERRHEEPAPHRRLVPLWVWLFFILWGLWIANRD